MVLPQEKVFKTNGLTTTPRRKRENSKDLEKSSHLSSPIPYMEVRTLHSTVLSGNLFIPAIDKHNITVVTKNRIFLDLISIIIIHPS